MYKEVGGQEGGGGGWAAGGRLYLPTGLFGASTYVAMSARSASHRPR